MQQSANYLDLPTPFLVLAPMDDVTDTVFRSIIASCAPPDMYFTEFVNVDGLMSVGRSKLLKKARFTTIDRPLILQLWGLKPDNFEAVARQVADGTLAREFGLPEGVNYAGIDLNMGCPAKSEVSNGTCSALINNRELASAIIEATQRGLDGKLPLSVKTRVGFNAVDMTWIEFLLSKQLAMLTVHGRTRAQMSKVPADWELIGQARQLRNRIAPDTLIVGNGDVRDHAHGMELAERYGLDGIMIGRGVFHDPFVFAETSPWQSWSRDMKIALYQRHVELFAATWRDGERPVYTLNKFCKIYINGFDGAHELREQLMASESTAQLLTSLQALSKNR
ncbi:MAG TPA: tRNA-dihydrouridine synthase [Candidatus Saccharimonadales bacterium]|jgi:tRNA-dihydrouridine synthase